MKKKVFQIRVDTENKKEKINYLQSIGLPHCLVCHKEHELIKDNKIVCDSQNPTLCTPKCGKWYKEMNKDLSGLLIKENEEVWQKIEELLFSLHIRFCPLFDNPKSKITQANCNEVKDELRKEIHSLLEKSRNETKRGENYRKGYQTGYEAGLHERAIKADKGMIDYFKSLEGSKFLEEILQKNRKQAIEDFLKDLDELPRIEITHKDGSKSRAVLEHSLELLKKTEKYL